MITRFRYWVVTGERRGIAPAAGLIALCFFTFYVWGCVEKKYRLQEIQCLAMNIYHEARGEPREGKVAIGIVSMNRMVSERFPDNLCHVVYQRKAMPLSVVGQFSWTQDNITDVPLESQAWAESMRVAEHVLADYPRMDKLNEALYYHADHITPAWAAQKTRVAQIGHHIFYR